MKGLRGDRIVIDDPHGSATPEEIEAARRRFAEAVQHVPRDGKVVIIMARLHRE